MRGKQLSLLKKEPEEPSDNPCDVPEMAASSHTRSVPDVDTKSNAKNDKVDDEKKPSAEAKLPDTHHSSSSNHNQTSVSYGRDVQRPTSSSTTPFPSPYFGKADIHASYVPQPMPFMEPPPSYLSGYTRYSVDASYHHLYSSQQYTSPGDFHPPCYPSHPDESFYFPAEFDLDGIPPPPPAQGPPQPSMQKAAAPPLAPPSSTKCQIDEVTPFDILTGRGAPRTYHYGNQHLDELVGKYGKLYACSKRSEKPRIAASIVQKVHAEGGRFLQRAKGSRGKHGGFTWTEIPEHRAHDKVSQMLRDAASKVEKEIKEDLGKENALNRAV